MNSILYLLLLIFVFAGTVCKSQDYLQAAVKITNRDKVLKKYFRKRFSAGFLNYKISSNIPFFTEMYSGDSLDCSNPFDTTITEEIQQYIRKYNYLVKKHKTVLYFSQCDEWLKVEIVYHNPAYRLNEEYHYQSFMNSSAYILFRIKEEGDLELVKYLALSYD